MKIFRNFLVIMAALLFIPAGSFAIVDASIYGGYSFGGEIDYGTSKSDVDGFQYGFRAHINMGIPFLITFGLGGFYQNAPMEYEGGGSSGDLSKISYGFDAYVKLDLEVLPIWPYIRGGIAIKDIVEMEVGNTTTRLSEGYFKSNYYGIGIAYPLLDAVAIDIQLTLEYLYTTSKPDDDAEVMGNAINLGVLAKI